METNTVFVQVQCGCGWTWSTTRPRDHATPVASAAAEAHVTTLRRDDRRDHEPFAQVTETLGVTELLGA